MGNNSAAEPGTLSEHFFAIRQEDINRDLAAPFDPQGRPSSRGQSQDDLHLSDAQDFHWIFVDIYKAQQSGSFALEDYLFLAAKTATLITTDFIEAALDKKPLKTLGELLDSIKAREGRANELCWVDGDGPVDYEKASDEYSSFVVNLLEAVHTTIFTRYRLTSVLDLYESDYFQYENLRIKGEKRYLQNHSLSNSTGVEASETRANARILVEQALRWVNLGLAKSVALGQHAI